MKRRIALLLLAVAAGPACSEQTFTPDAAASVIRNVEGFKRPAHVRIHTGVPLQSVFRCLEQVEAQRTPLTQFLVERGWVRFETRDAMVGLGTKASCPALALTSAGHAASAQWTKGPSGSGQGTAWAVPVGHREFLRVGRLSTAPDRSAHVEFDWKWTPNETGTALRKSITQVDALFAQVRTGRASCRSVNDDWQCQLGMWTTPADAGELSL
jgi:hypothetical protein